MILIQVSIFLFGLYVTALAMISAVRTLVLPRSARDPVAAAIFGSVRRLFNLRLRWANSYSDRDRIMAFYAPFSLLSLLPIWLLLVLLGHTAMFWALGAGDWWHSFTVSGSSLLTLGFAQGSTFIHTLLAFTEATIGLILVALLIAYLPTMYTAFSRRETAVNRLGVRAGSPPTAPEMLLRYQRLSQLDRLSAVWYDWEIWFSELEESHTSLAALVFFRSPEPDHSWITAAGAILDAAALTAATLDLPRDPQADLCIRAGYLALRRIADFFQVEYNPNPRFPEEPISITRGEFEETYDLLQESGLPMRVDREEAWQDFAGWRVNYDRVLLALCALTMAPYAPWSSDRSAAFGTSPLVPRIRRRK